MEEYDSEDDAKHVDISPEVYANFLDFLIQIINYTSGSFRVISELKDLVKSTTVKNLTLELVQGNEKYRGRY